jgi:glycosyltransferase involved in cell wall biosynthesis
MAHGLPVISSDLPTSKELMGAFGLYFNNGDAASLAQRLQEATTLDWPARSAEALALARRFDLRQIVSQWESVLKT